MERIVKNVPGDVWGNDTVFGSGEMLKKKGEFSPGFHTRTLVAALKCDNPRRGNTSLSLHAQGHGHLLGLPEGISQGQMVDPRNTPQVR